ncbi:MAG: hypothetical protein HWD62_08335 [Cyclobacteriaceae bacterium]|nr:MAG: hypothetical protein HWD62_08335 [Cyclobacteriaceae bacterium]
MRINLLAIIFLLGVCQTLAQERPISISVANSTLTDFAQKLENFCDCRLFFNPAETDSIRITVTAERKMVTQILELALKDTPLQFSMDANRYVYIKPFTPILVDLPLGFFANSGF